MTEKAREENYAKVIDFPKEVRVYGQISHVYFEGNDKVTTLIIDQKKPNSSASSSKKEKKTKEPVLIVPIKQKNSNIRFVKIPLQKLSKCPKAEKLGDNFCPKVSLQNGPPETEKVTEYSTTLNEICKKNLERRVRSKNEFDTCFVFQQCDPFQKDILSRSNLPIADLYRFEEKHKEEESVDKSLVEISRPVMKESASYREAETNTVESDRFMKYLISGGKGKRESK